MSAAVSRGRRRGAPDTRAAILAAAREAFGTSGYAGTTIRGIATRAGVDAALVHHYFGRKEDLFVAALELPIDPRQLLGRVAQAGPEHAGEALARTVVSVWEDPANRAAMLAVARSALDVSGQDLISRGFLPVLILPIGEQLGLDQPDRRMSLVASQVAGVILLRYLLALAPLAEMSADEVVTLIAPTLQHYLTGELPA